MQPTVDPPPEEILEKVHALGSEVWQRARAIAEEQLATERQALENARTELSEASQEATEIADRLTAENEQLKVAVANAETEAKEKDERISDLTAQLASAQATAEQLRDRLRHEEQRCTELLGKIEPTKPRSRRRAQTQAKT